MKTQRTCSWIGVRPTYRGKMSIKWKIRTFSRLFNTLEVWTNPLALQSHFRIHRDESDLSSFCVICWLCSCGEATCVGFARFSREKKLENVEKGKKRTNQKEKKERRGQTSEGKEERKIWKILGVRLDAGLLTWIIRFPWAKVFENKQDSPCEGEKKREKMRSANEWKNSQSWPNGMKR